MSIEVTSIAPDRRRFSLRKFAATVRIYLPDSPLTNKQLVVRCAFGLLAIAAIAGADTLLRSYKYYSRIIDARLASGYLTSRPGLYAAPRTIERGQKLSKQDLIQALRRVGYVDSSNSNIWNGSFRETNSTIEITPAAINGNKPAAVTVLFKNNREIEALLAGNLTLDTFALAPEVLTNDLSSKTGEPDNLSYAEIPLVLNHAILSIEDQRFFQHPGVDVWGIARALVRNAGDDRVGQGGSTITQQLVKNTYLTSEKTFARKYAEAMLAFALERRLSKQDIFALYCNEVYLGQRGAVGVRGVRQAARMYFGKELKDISLAEAATIAGLVQGPARYSPVHHAEAAQARRTLVLAAMLRDGWITKQQADNAATDSVALFPLKDVASVAPYFVDYVDRLSDQYDAQPARERIYTTIDLDLQRLAENALRQQLDRLAVASKNGAAKPQGALVALDPKTGNVLAMVGGRDYAESQLNRVTDARRQPGSTFKPFVYAAALEDGMSPVQTFSDAPREFVYDHTRIYRPANFGNGYSGSDVTMRTALVKSLNVVTVDVALQTGLARIANLASDFGLPRPERYPSMALGTEEVTPLQLAAAYAVFANGGRRVVPKVIASVGEPPASHGNNGNNSAPVISPTTAYMITNMLEAVVDHGTAHDARGALKGTSFAAKTGTSRDGWFVGYTPNLVCVVWIGFDDNRQLGLTGAASALPAWVNFMQGAVAARPELGGGNFECPEGIEFVEIDADNGLRSTLTCPHRELIAVTEKLAPNLECYRHGNLTVPVTNDVDDLMELKPSLVTQHPTMPNSSTGTRFSLLATRVEVDRHGQRSLVNEMR
ncbi:MAG: penicillin-binding protein [Pyrinomonadaceae bacterium]|jgi:penicillin-binding protein 1B|nr:penicillin-binding protein [Pyrinomonadaceae bacterium]